MDFSKKSIVRLQLKVRRKHASERLESHIQWVSNNNIQRTQAKSQHTETLVIYKTILVSWKWPLNRVLIVRKATSTTPKDHAPEIITLRHEAQKVCRDRPIPRGPSDTTASTQEQLKLS
jgi:hypothetical protein